MIEFFVGLIIFVILGYIIFFQDALGFVFESMIIFAILYCLFRAASCTGSLVLEAIK